MSHAGERKEEHKLTTTTRKLQILSAAQPTLVGPSATVI
jgi:hypothetical protein